MNDQEQTLPVTEVNDITENNTVDYAGLDKYNASTKALAAFEGGDITRADILLKWDANKNKPVKTADGTLWQGGKASAQALRDKRELMLKMNQETLQFDTAMKDQHNNLIAKTLKISPDAKNYNGDKYYPDEAEAVAIAISSAYEMHRKARNDALAQLN